MQYGGQHFFGYVDEVDVKHYLKVTQLQDVEFKSGWKCPI